MTLAPEKQENPLLEGLGIARTPESCAVVIFGASGDLTHKKLFPALYSLAFRHLLPRNFAVLGVARTEGSDEEFREDMKSAVQEHGRDPFREDIWETLAEGMRYLDMDFRDDASWNKVTKALADLDKNMGTGGNRVYYFAVPPAAIGTLVEEIGKRRSKNGWNRLVIEKPFGNDLSSARELNGLIAKEFDESEVFRIDHYLGKETVQNMLALRFANGIFEPVWNRQFIDHVQITVAESIGIENRAGYYESAGVIRDVFQNHLLQLVALTAMEPPIDFSAEAVRNEKVKVLRSLHTPRPKHIVRGQYGRGWIDGGRSPPTARRRASRPIRSPTRSSPPSSSWTTGAGRTRRSTCARGSGSRDGRRRSRFSSSARRTRRSRRSRVEGLRPNVLVVHVQPDEGVSLSIGAKVPARE